MKLADTLCVPLGAYILITLVLPALNGAAARVEFWHHAAVVLAACGVVAVVAYRRRTS